MPIYDSIPRTYYECLPDVYSYPTYPYLHPNNRKPCPIRKELGYPRFHTPYKGDHVLMPSPDEHFTQRIIYPNAHPRSQCSHPRAFPDQYGYPASSARGSVENPSDKPYLEYLIDVRSVINGQNKRLTVMLRNVPNRYTPADLKKVLDMFIYSCFLTFASLIEKYQIVTFPNDMKTHRNLGYAFISLSDNPSLLTLYRHVGDVPLYSQRCTMNIGQIVITKKCAASAIRL